VQNVLERKLISYGRLSRWGDIIRKDSVFFYGNSYKICGNLINSPGNQICKLRGPKASESQALPVDSLARFFSAVFLNFLEIKLID